MNKTITITIDGPAGAGKSTVSKLLASKIGYVYVDTGALYRGVALEVKKAKIDYKDKNRLSELLKDIKFDCEMKNNNFRLMSNSSDISGKIRTSEISMLASKVSAEPMVRATLLGIQKDIAVRYNAVFEGRDMGTVVFPEAQYKFFLIADLKTRAQRRYKEVIGSSPLKVLNNLNKIEKDIATRDHHDSTRAESPLEPAADSVLIDSTNLTIEQVVDKMYSTLKIS